MARPAAATANALPTDTTSINLDRILSRLEHTLLSTDGDPNLRTSDFERTKVGVNLEHARSLLLRLEHDSADIRIQSKKQAVQAALQAKRELIKRLSQRLYELNQLDSDSSSESEDGDSESDGEEEGGDRVPSYAPARADASSGIDASQKPENEAFRSAAEGLTSSIRARRAQTTQSSAPAEPTPTATTTGTSLFGNATKARATTDVNVASNEAVMSHQRGEQEQLGEALLAMAAQLKTSANEFQGSLNADKEVVDAAGKSVEKSTAGMDAASRRMGTLRRMTEGKGFLARLKLYALIAGLWFVAFAIVFILPKFRF